MGQQVEDERLRRLMTAYQDGAYDAFEELYKALVGPVRGWLAGRLHDRSRTEDLVQDTFLQIHRARRTYDPTYPVLPWVMAIARYVYLMDRRTASRRPRFLGEERASDATVLPDVERRLRGAAVRQALRQVRPAGRTTLLLHHLAGWSFRDIARALGIRETAARLRSSRAAAELRDALNDDEELP
jgi:RNA polymerase sigma-70 factor (ECF subfamily)